MENINQFLYEEHALRCFWSNSFRDKPIICFCLCFVYATAIHNTMTIKINKVNILKIALYLTYKPPKSVLNFKQRRREDFSCYSSRSGVWKYLLRNE